MKKRKIWKQLRLFWLWKNILLEKNSCNHLLCSSYKKLWGKGRGDKLARSCHPLRTSKVSFKLAVSAERLGSERALLCPGNSASQMSLCEQACSAQLCRPGNAVQAVAAAWGHGNVCPGVAEKPAGFLHGGNGAGWARRSGRARGGAQGRRAGCAAVQPGGHWGSAPPRARGLPQEPGPSHRCVWECK